MHALYLMFAAPIFLAMANNFVKILEYCLGKIAKSMENIELFCIQQVPDVLKS